MGLVATFQFYGQKNSIFISVGKLIYNPVVIPTLSFSDILSRFFFPLIITPRILQLSIFPPFSCLHLSNICRLLSCHPLSHRLAELYRFSTFYLSFKGRPPRPWVIFHCSLEMCSSFLHFHVATQLPIAEHGVLSRDGFPPLLHGNWASLPCSVLQPHRHCWSALTSPALYFGCTAKCAELKTSRVNECSCACVFFLEVLCNRGKVGCKESGILLAPLLVFA